ncbi:MAG: amylo-alpha-1,6-glucosidase [Phycisphaerales bacterium]
MEIKESILIDGKNVFMAKNSAGLRFSIFDNGVVENITCGKTQLNLINASPLGSSSCNLYLRKRTPVISAVSMLGSPSVASNYIEENTYETKGEFEGVQFRCRLMLCPRTSKWLWSVQLCNNTNISAELDLLCVQNVGLSCADGNEQNDYYISQYIDYTPLWEDDIGYVICCRQNEHGKGSFPWLAMGSLSKVKSFSTDGMQFYGTSYRQTAVPQALSMDSLPGLKQGEFGVVALQCEPFIIKAGQTGIYNFFGIYQANHPAATTSADVEIIAPAVDELKILAETAWSEECVYSEPVANIFSQALSFDAEDCSDAELDVLFDANRRHCEFHNGKQLSFFYGDERYVTLREKEMLAYRSCGHIIKTDGSLPGDETVMSASCFMPGVFLSHLAQGNVNFNRLLTVNTNPLNFIRSSGLRIFVKQAGQYYLLSVPSAFEISLNGCRWIYKNNETLFEILCRADANSPKIRFELNVLKGEKPQWLITCELAAEHKWQTEMNGELKLLPGEQSVLKTTYPAGSYAINFDRPQSIEQIGSDEMLFADGKSRGLDFIVLKLVHTGKFAMTIDGKLSTQSKKQIIAASNEQSRFVNMDISSVRDSSQIGRIAEILPWFLHNAKIHYAAPHGLEQYGGAAWGTRDVCQGPLEMLLAVGNYDYARKILVLVFANQNSDGNWPQWWMFDRYKNIRAAESHGDVIFWPLIALCEYIECSGDYDLLNEMLPYYHLQDSRQSEPASVFSHVMRAVEHITTLRFAGDTKLVNYSDGDWDDAMQPADKSLKKRLVSSWTVALCYEAFVRLTVMCRAASYIEPVEQLEQLCERIQADFNKYLIKDDIVAGFGLRDSENKFDLLLHPSDKSTGIHYRLLPMVQGILSGIFTPKQSKTHIAAIHKYLKGIDGIRLMDRPVQYHGGIQKIFKRAESSAFFGREIGLMYSHAHLRYAEALARIGNSDEFVNALLQIVPIDIQSIVPQVDIRQSNCYYSSSDADFVNRAGASEHYDDLLAGKIPVKGGWRVYSSGPGMFVAFVIRYVLGIRRSCGRTIFDPVMPAKFDGLAANIKLFDKDVKIIYHISVNKTGVREIKINGKQCGFDMEQNLYRIGGASLRDSSLKQRLDINKNVIELYM